MGLANRRSSTNIAEAVAAVVMLGVAAFLLWAAFTDRLDQILPFGADAVVDIALVLAFGLGVGLEALRRRRLRRRVLEKLGRDTQGRPTAIAEERGLRERPALPSRDVTSNRS